MSQCCIEGCPTSSDKDVTFFDFPTSRLLRKRWLDAIGCGKLAGEPRLCSRHFATHEYVHVRGRTRLRGKVLPTLCLDGSKPPKTPKDPLATTGNTTENEETLGSTDKESNNDHNGNNGVDKADSLLEDKEKDNSPSKENGHNENEANEQDDQTKTDKDSTINQEEEDKAVKTVIKRKITDKIANKRVKKKWVPMRPRPVNGQLSDSSQDSVNSDDPPPPVLEDLEEHLPNYHIANMKTERQVAAMTDTIDPIEEVIDPADDVEEITVEPHVPVFIELSVGQAGPEEQGNDCLMVIESVQCDIDPTLMLQARAEDEECCELIDIDDDDDAPVIIHTDNKKKSPKKSIDPISLLTSSDEDDVILQEPHIDTLSVSDETDEDDLPLQKLIKREKKAKKKKKKRKEAVRNILVGKTDFYCTYCQHVSKTKSLHDKHLKTHLLAEPSQATTRVYQICKECGFTTSSKSQLNRHQRKHLNEKRFKCPLCSYRSKYNMSLMYHLKTHNYDPNMYNCGACGLELDSKKALLEHQDGCNELSEKFICKVCGYVARSKRTLRSHRNSVHRDKD